MAPDSRLTYKDSGVDIEAGDALVERIKPIIRRTLRPEVLAGPGGFGALFELPIDHYREPVLVSGTDGVGTKLKLAIELGRHDTVGIDLVAMCVNDVIVQGAEPLFFLDYFATGRLDIDVAEQVVSGIARGCEQAGAALVGGETAEMPGMYAPGDYDLAGFCVGVVEKSRIIDGSRTTAGDAIIGLTSSGLHSNGYSLVRRLLADAETDPNHRVGRHLLSDLLLAPTCIYAKPIMALTSRIPIHGIAHITGGGLPGNVIRVLPEELEAVINTDTWPRPAVFEWLESAGRIARDEMYRTFNCGIGMTVCLAREHLDEALALLSEQEQEAHVIGTVVAGSRRVVLND